MLMWTQLRDVLVRDRKQGTSYCVQNVTGREIGDEIGGRCPLPYLEESTNKDGWCL